eukprot:3997030-Pleurochrysis_carterae.AAC.1
MPSAAVDDNANRPDVADVASPSARAGSRAKKTAAVPSAVGDDANEPDVADVASPSARAGSRAKKAAAVPSAAVDNTANRPE